MRTSQSKTEITRRFRERGFVVLEGILSSSDAASGERLCLATSRRRNRRRVPVPYELMYRPPFKGIVRQTSVWDVLTSILDGTPQTGDFCWFRIAPPGGSAIDRIHRDCRTARGTPPVVSVDVLLTDFTEENGATELWGGTQHTYDDDPAAARGIEASLPQRGERITGTAGSVVLRDQRAWHRGGVNRTESSRCMFTSVGWRAA